MFVGRLSKQDATDLLRSCREYGWVDYGRHFLQELEHDGLTLPDVEPVFDKGVVYDEPELHIRSGKWRYKLEGLALDGRRVAIVFTFDSETEAVVITAYVGRG